MAMEAQANYRNVIEEIDSIDSIPDLKNIHKHVIARLKAMTSANNARVRLDFNKGDEVRMKEEHLSRNDRLVGMTGEITKCNPKKAKVMFGMQQWKIPYAMLEKV